MNNVDEVVGTQRQGNGSVHAYVFSGGKLTDLNSEIVGIQDWTLAYADAINDRGQIVGVGSRPGVVGDVGYVLTPLADVTPPELSAASNVSKLWPPNGRTTSVVVTGTAADDDSFVDTATLSYAVRDEYGEVQPRGTFTLAPDGSFSFAVPLVAARKGEDLDGRTYEIVVKAADRAGNMASRTVRVTVPHDGR